MAGIRKVIETVFESFLSDWLDASRNGWVILATISVLVLVIGIFFDWRKKRRPRPCYAARDVTPKNGTPFERATVLAIWNESGVPILKHDIDGEVFFFTVEDKLLDVKTLHERAIENGYTVARKGEQLVVSWAKLPVQDGLVLLLRHTEGNISVSGQLSNGTGMEKVELMGNHARTWRQACWQSFVNLAPAVWVLLVGLVIASLFVERARLPLILFAVGQWTLWYLHPILTWHATPYPRKLGFFLDHSLISEPSKTRHTNISPGVNDPVSTRW